MIDHRFPTLSICGPVAVVAIIILGVSPAIASNVVPEVIKQPGSQVLEASPSSSRCENCHGGSYDEAVEPGFNWRGSMMSHATRDPIFWATVDIAEQDFMPNLTVWNNLNPGEAPGTDPPGGVGDLCIRCHTPEGWLSGNSVPTDGSGLSPSSDFDGVSCDSCHRMMDPGTPDARVVMTPGNEAYWIDPSGALEPFYGSGQFVIDPGGDKRGPFDDADAKSHGPIASSFHRSGDFCGTCHDVSNPAVGNYAPNHGRLDSTPLPIDFCLLTGSPCIAGTDCLDCDGDAATCETACGGTWEIGAGMCDRRDTCRTKVADAYPPYMYGVVERTYSEWKSSAWPALQTATFMSDPDIPEDLKRAGGAPAIAALNAPYNSSTDPAYNPPRYFTCQSCHMPSVTGQGCNKDPEIRTDMPLHDQTGGNTWMPLAMIDMSNAGTLFGGELPADQIPALQVAVERARAQLGMSIHAGMVTTAPGGLLVRITNLTGHKFLSGYPEGRRAWINVRWFDAGGLPIHEDGAYDATTALLDGRGTRVYAAHPGMSREWAELLLSVGYDPAHALTFDMDGNVTKTLGELASGSLGPALKTFHFVLNNVMVDDHRIPPFGFNPGEAAKRNATPVPADAYATLPDGTLQHWDDIPFPVPIGAARAEVQVYYQSTSPEYINFLRRANTTTTRGEEIYQAWLNTGMSPPEPLLYSSGVPSVEEWIVPACDGPPAAVGATLALSTAERRDGVGLSWGGVADATGYLVHRWGSANHSGPELMHDVAGTILEDDGTPVQGAAFYYEVGSTTACGETAGEFSSTP
jgi:hypothetical protein